MSKTSIPFDVKAELWWRAAGRCEFKGCNKPLDSEGLTWDKCNLSENAHIVADSVNGPRGDKDLSEKLCKDFNNLMLLCSEHHHYIDTTGKDRYDKETLRAMKKAHEKRMKMLTGIPENNKVHIVSYTALIAETKPQIQFKDAVNALLPDYFAFEDDMIDLSNKATLKRSDQDFWKNEIESLNFLYKDLIADKISRWDCKSFALFALAPMPLLVKLGTFLNNKMSVLVYQKKRNSDDWNWNTGEKIEFVVKEPEMIKDKQVLVFSLSDSIIERIRNRYADSASIWEVTVANPNKDLIQTKNQLVDFSQKVECLLDHIKGKTGALEIDVFMAMPASCAVELGRVWQPKANMKMHLYDYNVNISQRDEFALTIEG